MNTDRACLHALVSGLVQGVGYRLFVRRHAVELGLTGWVHNLPDGRVELEAEGERAALDTLLAHLRQGPRDGRVDHMAVTWQAAQGGEVGFEIRRPTPNRASSP